jgi:hypothetical protein
VRIIGQVFPPLTWQISQTIVDCLSLVIYVCVFNQSHGHWLLSDVLHSAISMSLKLKEENQILPSFESLMDDDSIVSVELSLLASNIRKEVINVLDCFLSFFKIYDKKKTHNMIFLMLNPWYKSLHVVSSFVGTEQGVAFVEEYDKKSLYPMLVECHEHLYPLMRSKTDSIN